MQNNTKKERDLTSRKTKFFCFLFLSTKAKLKKDAKRKKFFSFVFEKYKENKKYKSLTQI
jgi:hypothetical protein